MQALLAAFLILVPAPAADEEPVGSAPTLEYLKWTKGAFETSRTVTELRTEIRTELVNVNGKQVALTRQVTVPVMKQVKVMLDAKGTEVYGLDGKKIDESTWQKALSAGAVTIVTHDGQLPHPGFRKVFREGTLIVVFKPAVNPPLGPIAVPAPNGPKN